MLDVVVDIAWGQHGAIGTHQAEAKGVARSTLARGVTRGSLIRRAPGVYVLAGAPRSARQDAMVHVLAAGPEALAGADTALALRCPELPFPPKPVILVPRSCGYRARTADLRRVRDLHLANPGRVDGIPTAGLARSLLDAAVGRTPDEVLTRIDACRRHTPLAVGALVEVLEQHRGRGRPGVTSFRAALLALRAEVADSEFERLVVRDLTASGMPAPRLHHVVRAPGRGSIELDVDWPGLLVDVELDGRDHADRARTMRRDRARDRVLQALGYIVARYTWDDYVTDRAGMIDEIAAFVGTARRAAA